MLIPKKGALWGSGVCARACVRACVYPYVSLCTPLHNAVYRQPSRLELLLNVNAPEHTPGTNRAQTKFMSTSLLAKEIE